VPPVDHQGPQVYYEPVTTLRDGAVVTTYQLRTTSAGQSAAANEVTLSRAAYKLPAGKAEALAKFLNEQVKAVVLETKVDGETIIVTTTPEMQRTIGQFMTLLRAKAAKSDTGTTVPR
jgi:hypothetical protein